MSMVSSLTLPIVQHRIGLEHCCNLAIGKGLGVIVQNKDNISSSISSQASAFDGIFVEQIE